MKYKCITKCFYNSRLYTVGEVLTVSKDERPPRHFVLSSKYSKPVVDPKVQDQKALEALGHTKDTSEEIAKPKAAKPKPKGKAKEKEEDFLK